MEDIHSDWNNCISNTLAKHPGQHLYVLVDGAILHDASESLRNRWARQSAHSTFPQSVGDEAKRVGPLLFQNLPLHGPAVSLYHPFDPVSGRMLGSTLISPLSLLDLSKRLAPLLDVVLADGVAMVMRFHDPRVLPFWLEMLPLPYRNHLAGCVTEWIYLDASWNVKSMSFTAAPATEPPAFPIKLEQDTENRLMEACFPYWLMEQLRTEKDAAVRPVLPTNFYIRLCEQLQRARSHGLQTTSDLKIYCNLSIQLGKQFDEHHLLKRLWVETAEGKSLLDVLNLVSDDDWKEVRKSVATPSPHDTD